MLIGITGQIGAGKSVVADVFKRHGAAVISADDIGKKVVENDKNILDQLVNTFGMEILTPTGRLRRKKLGEIAFASSENKKRLNKIVHPHLLRELRRQIRQASDKFELVVIDAALLLDWQLEKILDLTILVHSSDKIKIERLMSKDYSRREVKMRLRSQMNFEAMKKRADIVVYNNKSLESLELKTEKIIKKVLSKIH